MGSWAAMDSAFLTGMSADPTRFNFNFTSKKDSKRPGWDVLKI